MHDEYGESLKGTAIVRWTGRGRFADLESSVRRILGGARAEVRVSRVGGSLLVDGAEPASVAIMLRHTPGVSWIAVGVPAGSYSELGGASKSLARRYLRKGDRFAALAETTGSAVASDVSGAVASAALGMVEGARTDEDAPRIRFRAAFDGEQGAVGVHILDGAGGVPTGSERAACLVSGGEHSSVAAWMTVLSGYRVTLVHWKVDDGSLREVARLYSELSFRADYSKVRLEVFAGGSVAKVLAAAAEGHPRVFGGFHSGCSEVPRNLAGRVEAPLFLLPEEKFDQAFKGLGLRGTAARTDWTERGGRGVSRWSFGGIRADVSEVLDGLTRRPLRAS